MGMTVLFEADTELGRCDLDRMGSFFAEEPGPCLAFASTSASLTGSNGVVRIEQRCYVRCVERSDDVRLPGWMPPEMTVEPMAGSKEETIRSIELLHEQFVAKTREALADRALLLTDDPIPEPLEPREP